MKATREQKLKVKKIAKDYGLKLIIAFGSFASGRSRKDSDLDIGVLANNEVSFKKQVDLINEFSQIFKKNVDLTILATANPLLLFEAAKNAILLCGDSREFMKLKLKAFHVYNDYSPYFKMERELNRKIIKSYAN